MANGAFTRDEIASQPAVWRATLDAMSVQLAQQAEALAGLATRPWVVTGCGSTYYLSLHAASLLCHIGIQAVAVPASELVYFPQADLPRDFVLLTISRSGTTSETLWAMDTYRRSQAGRGKIVAITCVPDTPMIEKADIVLLSEAAREQSVAQTRSFSSMVIMAHCLAAALAGNPEAFERLQALPAKLEGIAAAYVPLMEQIGRDLSIDRIFFLGSGPNYGLASEMMLKTKEMSASWSEAYHTLEFRHGPVSVIAPSALVVGLVSDQAAAQELQVLKEMKPHGARTLAFCEQKGDLDWSGVDPVIEVHSGLDDWQRPVLYLPLVQMLAFYRAIARGADPDQPEKLTQVIVLK
jgi:glutamine---fructose-6-phosphate transaminase (isomerizing)